MSHDIKKQFNARAKDLMAECHENGVAAIFLAGFNDGETIRSATGLSQKLVTLMGIEIYTLSKQINCPLKDILGAISECARDCAKVSNDKWKPSDDAGSGNGK